MSSTKYAYLLWHISLWLFFLLLCIFCISLTSPLLWEYTQLVCASAQLFLGFCIENEGRSGCSHSCQWQPWGSRALEILSKDSETDGNEHVALNRRVHCSSNFQFRDISVNSLGNFKGLSRSQSLLMLQTYGRNLKKSVMPELNVSPADALDECEIEYHYQDTSFTLNLTALLRELCRRDRNAQKERCFLWKLCPVSWLKRVEENWVLARG